METNAFRVVNVRYCENGKGRSLQRLYTHQVGFFGLEVIDEAFDLLEVRRDAEKHV